MNTRNLNIFTAVVAALVLSACTSSRSPSAGGYEYDDIYFASNDYGVDYESANSSEYTENKGEPEEGDYYDPDANKVPKEQLYNGGSQSQRGNFNDPQMYGGGGFGSGISPYTSVGIGLGYSRFNRGYGSGMGFGDPFMRHGMYGGRGMYGYDPFMNPYGRRSSFGMSMTYGNPYMTGYGSPMMYDPWMRSRYGMMSPYSGMYGSGMYAGGMYGSGMYGGGMYNSMPASSGSGISRNRPGRNQISTRPSYATASYQRPSRGVDRAPSSTETGSRSGKKASGSEMQAGGKRTTSRPDFSTRSRSISRSAVNRSQRTRAGSDRTAATNNRATDNYRPYGNTDSRAVNRSSAADRGSSSRSRNVRPSRSHTPGRSVNRSRTTRPRENATQSRSRRSFFSSPSRTRSRSSSPQRSRSRSYSTPNRSYSTPNRSRSSGSRSFSRPSRSSSSGSSRGSSRGSRRR